MKSTFKNKLFFKIAVILTVFIVVLSIVFLGYASASLHSDSVKNLNYSAQKTANEIDNLISSMDSLALNLSTNIQVRDFFTHASDSNTTETTTGSDEQVIDVLLSAMIPTSVSKFRISLYNQNGNFISAGLAYNQNVAGKLLDSEDYVNWYEYKEILGQSGGLLDVTKDFWSTSVTSTITLYRNIYHSSNINQSAGIVEVQCPIEYLKEFMSTQSAPYHYRLSNENGRTIYGSDPYPLDEADYITSSIVMNSGWELTVSCPKSFVFRLLFPILFYILLTYVVMLGLCLLIINQTIKKMTKPLAFLTNTIHNVTLQQPDLWVSFTGYPDEFEQLNKAFSQMMERLQLYMDENIKRKSYEMQANMIALQSQMNPHFLYNTLAVIKAHSIEENYALVGSACDYLAQMLRYISVYSEQKVPLSSEINHCILYLKLMKIRYEDSFLFSVTISEDLDSSQIFIPRLCLQPLLENCFQHGFKKVVSPWEITVDCCRKENSCQIAISDNGSGFSQESIKKLQAQVDAFLSEPSASLPSLSIGGMGLINTIVRMKLNFHEDFSYHINSDEQSCVTKIIFELKHL